MHATIEFEDLFEWTWEPKQRIAVKAADLHRFPLFGGARGPGKSFWLRWILVRYHFKWAMQGVTNIRTMLACESFPTLYDRQMVKIIAEFPDWMGEWRPGVKEFAFHDHITRTTTDGRRVGFDLGGAICLRNLDDPSKYASAEFAAMGIDELTRYQTRSVFDSLRGSLRWPGIEGCPLYTVAMPTGPGLPWVRSIWKERDFPPEYGEIADQIVFIPGLPQDNSHLTDDYWAMLRSQTPVLRKAWEEGDWYSGIEGSIYPNFSSAAGGNVTEEAEFVAGRGPVEWWIDDGFSGEHPFCALMVQAKDGGRFFDVFYEMLVSFKQHDEIVEELADEGYPLPEVACIPSESGRLAQVLWKPNIRTSMSTHLVEEGTKVVRQMISDGSGNRRLRVHPRCRQTILSLSTLPTTPGRNDRPLKVNGTPGDHPADAIRYGCWWRRN